MPLDEKTVQATNSLMAMAKSEDAFISMLVSDEPDKSIDVRATHSNLTFGAVEAMIRNLIIIVLEGPGPEDLKNAMRVVSEEFDEQFGNVDSEPLAKVFTNN